MFTENKVYKRSKIHDKFGGQRQGGISTPADYDDIFIFTNDSGEDYGYEDGWVDENTFKYTGEGQVGDMKFIRGNKAIRDHLQNNKTIHLFKYVDEGYVKYFGELYYSNHKFIKTKDKNDNLRKSIQFTLKRININGNNLEKDRQKSEKDINELRNKALNSASNKSNKKNIDKKKKKNITTTVCERSQAIKKYALKRSNGYCELCGEKAPFIKDDGNFYLEVHHIKKLSDNGPDHPKYVAAVCPNCHAKAHYAMERNIIKNKLLKIIEEKERLYK